MNKLKVLKKVENWYQRNLSPGHRLQHSKPARYLFD